MTNPKSKKSELTEADRIFFEVIKDNSRNARAKYLQRVADTKMSQRDLQRTYGFHRNK